MSAQDDDNETNYWPGYVDALTTMTMVLTFVMMILAIGVYMLSESLSKSLLAKLLRQAGVEVAETASEDEIRDTLSETLAKAQMKPDVPQLRASAEAEGAEDSEDTPKEVVAERTTPAQKTPGKVVVRREGSLLRVSYEGAETRLNEHSRGEIAAFADESTAIHNAKRIIIRAHAAPESGGASQARRLAYYRAMILRNELIALGFETYRLRIEVDETEDAKAGQTAEIFAR